MDNKDKNILVIGNGFDLAHGLPTSYKNFIDYIKKVDATFAVGETAIEFNNIIRQNGFIRYFLKIEQEMPGWIDCEREIKRVIRAFFNVFEQEQYINGYNGRINDKELKFGDKTCLQSFESIIEDDGYTMYGMEITSKYFNPTFGIKKKEILKELKHQLEDLIRALQLYLQEYMMVQYSNENNGSDKLERIRQIENINFEYVISFNYTNIYELYGIDKEDVYHVHGSLEENNMVLGFDDDNSENLDFVYFKKYFQRIQKLTGYIDNNKFYQHNEFGEWISPIIHFYGHSLDKTDGDIIGELRSMAEKMIIYYYCPNEEMSDYEQKVINLIDIFGKDKATQMIQTGFIEFVKME